MKRLHLSGLLSQPEILVFNHTQLHLCDNRRRRPDLAVANPITGGADVFAFFWVSNPLCLSSSSVLRFSLIILFGSITLLTGMTGISLHMQWPLTTQSHGRKTGADVMIFLKICRKIWRKFWRLLLKLLLVVAKI
jgi:hypothetical protein